MPSNITQIPAPRVPVIDANTGLMSREWYRFFINLFDLTGEGSNTTSLTDLQVGPPSLDGFAFNTTSYADLAPPVIPALPAGSTTQVQFNNNGLFGASANFLYDTGTNTFTVGPAGATTTIETLAPTGATVAGTLRLRGKNASATNGAGGGLQFTGGNALGTGTAGGFAFTGGTSGATGGSFIALTGQGTGVGGEIRLESGNGTGATGTGGRFLLNAGSGIGDGGAFEMNGGQATNGIGGGFLLQSGFSINDVGGDFLFIALGGPLGNGNMYFDTDLGGTVIQLTATTGGAPQLGFYGAVPVNQQASAPVATDLATAITLVNALRTALLNLGLIV
jgi:hypothetical protein